MSNLNLDKFQRVNESVSPELLDQSELTRLINLVLDDETGRPKKRGGFTAFNSNQIDSTGTITSLEDIISSDGTNYMLAGINGKLRKSTNGTGTWSDVTDKGTPPYKMESYSNGFIFTEGTVAPFLVRGADLSTVTDLEITPMDVSAVNTGHATGGNLTLGMYKWVFCYVTEGGEMSPPSTPLTHHYDAAYITVQSTEKRIGFEGLLASTDSRVSGIRVFRTKVLSPTDTPEIYYYVTQLANEDQNWFDEMSDDDLGSEGFNFLSCPLTSKYLALHKDRIWQAYISRTVKNWTRPALSATDTFNATNGATTTAFTAGVAFNIANGGAASSSLSAGLYTYRIDFVDSDGIRSDPIQSNSVSISAGDIIEIRQLPFVNNPNIVRADVYRAIDGVADEDFYKVFDYVPTLQNVLGSYLAIDDTGFTDGTQYIDNQSTETTKTGIAFSEIGQPASYPLENLRNVYPDDGDEITGIKDDIDGILIVKRNSISKIYTSGSPENWRLVKLLQGVGCSEPTTLAKYGSEYYFVHYDKCYKFSPNGYEDIGELFKESLSGWTFRSSTITDRWYLLGVAYAPTYRVLVYDRMLKTWYKFTFLTDPYILSVKRQGTNTGKIITANTQYLLYYNTSSATDVATDMSTPTDISTEIRTKTFKVPDGISLIRIRRTKFNYNKLTDKNIVITVVNPDTGVTNTYTDSTNASSPYWKTYEPSQASDSLTVTPKLYISITGAGLTEWGDLRLEFRPINRGKASV